MDAMGSDEPCRIDENGFGLRVSLDFILIDVLNGAGKLSEVDQ